MDAKDYIVNDVLRDDRRFMVPIYQRQYQWGVKRLDPLWADIVAKADELLAGEAKFMHYLGALILAPTGDANKFAITPSIQVVDGQQRLTTFQIFLAALSEQARNLGIEGIEASVRHYLFNATKAQDTDPNARFKLTPTPADRKLFWTLMEGGLDAARKLHPDKFYQNGKLIRGQAPKALAAYDYFLEKVALYAEKGVATYQAEEASIDASPAERVHALINGLIGRMKLVVIELGETDDAQVIFETLNSQAEPLLAMDLVRNNIFHRAERQGLSVSDLHAELWEPFEKPFWKADAPRARPVRPRIEHFLSHALTAQTGAATSMRELYAEYRAFARPSGKERFPTVAEELHALVQFMPIYTALERQPGRDADLHWIGGKLAAWEVTTAYPLIFRIAVGTADPAERRRMYRMIYAYIVRRAVCLLTTKNMNNVFQRAVGLLLRDGCSEGVLTRALADQTGAATRFPSDDEFRKAIVDNPLYGRMSNPRLGDILWELELQSRTAKMENIERPENLWIEHVLPQSWTEHWPLPSGDALPLYSADSEVADQIQLRDRLKETLGNLTLLTSQANIGAGNGDFASKRQVLHEESLLALNRWLEDRPQWTEADIKERGAMLADRALVPWPAPVGGAG